MTQCSRISSSLDIKVGRSGDGEPEPMAMAVEEEPDDDASRMIVTVTGRSLTFTTYTPFTAKAHEDPVTIRHDKTVRNES